MKKIFRQMLVGGMCISIVLMFGSICKGVEYEYIGVLPPGWSSAFGKSINNSGAVVGYGSDGTTDKGFIYSDGIYTELLPPGWSFAYAYGINDSGEVVGAGYDGTTYKGFLYSAGVFTDIIPPGWSFAVGRAINNNGAVVGYGTDETYTTKVFLYSNGIYTDITPPGYSDAFANDINDNGEVVGAGVSGTNYKGFLYSSGVYTKLLPPGWNYAYNFYINNSGAVVGDGRVGGAYKGFLYSAGVYTDIIPPGCSYVFVYAINDSGAVVCEGNDGTSIKGFIYSAGVYTELLPPGWTSAVGKGINNSGAVVGAGYDGTNTKCFIATPKLPTPKVTIITPQANVAVQDGVVFQAKAFDFSGIYTVSFSVREPDGGEGIPIGYEALEATLNTVTDYWEYPFDTTRLQDGYYVIFATASDTAGNEGMSSLVPFSIRNWAVITQLPSTPNNKSGRTMPVKFSLRIAASVDPAMPFVCNEDLEIRIYDAKSPGTILQRSVYGTGSKDYRIDATLQLYQTNFQTGKTPATYVVEIWRPTKNFMVGSFTFKTVK